MLLFGIAAWLSVVALAARPVFLQAMVDSGTVGVKMLDETFLKSMNIGVEMLEKFMSPDLEGYINRGTQRLAEGEEVALMLLTPLSTGSIVMTPVKVGEAVMEDLVSKGQSLASDLASQPLLEILPGFIAKFREGVSEFHPELIPLATEEALHATLDNALSGLVGGGVAGVNFISNIFKVAPLGRAIVGNEL